MTSPVHSSGHKLRVAILGTRGIPARYGGFETFAEQLSVRLVKRGHEVTVYAEAEVPVQPDGWFEGVRVRYVRRPAWGAASVIAFDCACLWDSRSSYDVVYMLGYGAAWACWIPRVWGTPVWINVDGLEWARSKWSFVARTYLRAMEWASARAASRVIADSRAIADRFARLYPHTRCSHVAYGANIPSCDQSNSLTLDRWGLTPGGYWLVVARPEPENHVSEIALAFLRGRPNRPLVVVGDISDETAYQRELLRLACDHVRLVGGVYNAAELECLRTHAFGYLHGHSVGGTNPSLLEALACGNLVIAHDNVFNREVAADAAFYFRSADDLAEQIALLERMTVEDRGRIGALAREVIASRYTWESVTDAYENLLVSRADRRRL